MKLVKWGNSKLGKKILNFSLPPVTTCPGKSAFCLAHCYAKRYYKQYPGVRTAYDNNFEVSKTDEFASVITQDLAKHNKEGAGSVFRIHPSGDFYSAQYIDNWVKITQANQHVMFYGYTRSYTDPELLPNLQTLHDQENVVLFASTDDTMTDVVTPDGWRVAHASVDKPALPKLVTCLEQAGKVTTCEECGLCFKKSLTSNIWFIKH